MDNFIIQDVGGKDKMKLKEIRLEKNFSQKMLGDAVGLSYQAISHYEKGRRELPVSVAKKIGEVLEVDWWILYE